MKIQNAAVIGCPIGHTMSPFLQQRLFALAGAPMAYQVLELPDLEQGLPQLRRLDCFNVTIPYKRAILPFLAGVEEKARCCGSVNAVRVREGELYGSSTDGEGCFLALARHGVNFEGDILLLGNGGAARAIAFEIASRQRGFRLTIACRSSSYQRACSLADELAAYARQNRMRGFRIVVETYEELEADHRSYYDLLINATSVGMYPGAAACPVSEAVAARCGVVFDAVYNPRETELLKLAAKHGSRTICGMEMLVYQAAASHRFWYGTEFRQEDLTALCRDAQREMEQRFTGEGKGE